MRARNLTLRKLQTYAVNVVGLQTPAARLFVLIGVTSVIYIIGYQLLMNAPTFSVYSRIGIPSPSIGLTRAYWLLIHGDFAGAWQMNKMVYIVAFVLISLVVADGVSLFKKHSN